MRRIKLIAYFFIDNWPFAIVAPMIAILAYIYIISPAVEYVTRAITAAFE